MEKYPKVTTLSLGYVTSEGRGWQLPWPAAVAAAAPPSFPFFRALPIIENGESADSRLADDSRPSNSAVSEYSCCCHQLIGQLIIKMSASKLRLALIQMAIGENKSKNIARAVQLIREAAGGGAQLVALPECFNSPYGIKYFPQYAETVPGESTEALSVAAKKFGVYVVGGSIPERDGDKIYNTCTVWGPHGDMIAKHRKMHLFDINVPGNIVFRESDSLSPGSQFTAFDLPHCKIGVGICYDIRFAEMAQIYSEMGCKVLLYPGAFNMTTGPVHWELLQRGRALDNQVYVATISPARDTSADYIAWGHSSIINPWGEVIATSEDDEAIIYGDLDLDYVDKVRQMIPLRNQKRNDLYEINIK